MTSKGESIILGDFGFKIILFRVRAGYEKDIVTMLNDYLTEEINEKTNIIEFKIYKVLGLYDIMIILRCKNFHHDLLERGTFDHVIQSNEILCYNLYMPKANQFNLNNDLKDGIFISLLKLRLEALLDFGIDITNALAIYMEEKRDLIVLGGLGWNELLIIHPHNFQKEELEYIFSKFIYGTSSLYLPVNGKNYPLIHKTYSFLGVSYDVMDNLENTFPSSFDDSSTGPCPRLLISVPAHNFELVNKNIPKIFRKGKNHFDYDRPQVMTGIYDISLSFKKGTWGRFLQSIMDFRKVHSEIVLDTRTELGAYISPIDVSSPYKKKKHQKDIFPQLILGEDETIKILDRPGTIHVVSTIYRFNNFFQDPLIKDSFLDLFIPASKLISRVLGKNSSGKWNFNDKEINQLLVEFQWAIRERAMGAYLFTEDDEHSFSPIRGGLQKILLAMESIPYSILNKLVNRDFPWQGFISIGLKEEPMHFLENLHIPFDHALYPEKYWWCIIHEIGHMLAGLWNILDENDAAIKYAMNILPNILPKPFKNLADNCFADTFDFIIGFLCNRYLYFNVCWPFLLENIERQDQPYSFLKRHITRHFFVWIFEKTYLNKKINLQSLDDRDILNRECKMLLRNLESVHQVKEYFSKNISDKNAFSNDIVLETFPYLKLIDHYSKYFIPVVKFMKELKSEYHSARFKRMIKKIEVKGDILGHQEIKYPHLIPLKIMENILYAKKEYDTKFRTKMATILSLYWYSHNFFLPSILNLCKKEVSNSS